MRTFVPVPRQISDNRTLDADLRLKQVAYRGDNKVGAPFELSGLFQSKVLR